MTKVLFILSAVVILVASFFAYQNGREFASVRSKIAAINASILLEKQSETKMLSPNGALSKIKTELAAIQSEMDIEAEKLKAQKNRLANTANEIAGTKQEYEAKEKKKEEQDKLLRDLPKDMTPDTMVEGINKLKKDKLEFEAQAEAKKKEVTTEEDKVAGIQKRLDDVMQKIQDRSKNFERNSLSSRVVAVNHDWGFVIIDAGKDSGLTEQTKLIVTRGAQTVGKVSVMSVEGKNSMASIVTDAVANGQVIMPGDHVILENLVQN